MSAVGERKISSDFVFIRRVAVVFGMAGLVVAAWLLTDVILLLFGSTLFAMTLWALARPLTKAGLGETAALAVAGLFVLAVVVGSLFFFGAEIARQFEGISRSLSMMFTEVRQEFESGVLAEWFKGVNPATGLQGLASRVLAWGSSLAGALIGLVLVIVGGLYLAANPRLYRDGLITLVPPAYRASARATVRDSGDALHLWLRGQLIAMVLVGVLTGAGLWLAGVQSALALGVLAGLFNFVPYIGSISAAIITILIATGQGWDAVLWAAVVMAVVQQVESNLITPLVVGRAVSIAPAIGLFAIVAMGVLFGPLGLLFGFPLAIVTDTAVRRLYVRDTLDEPVEILGEPARKS